MRTAAYLLVILSLSLNAEAETPSIRTITVFGVASEQVIPDEAIWRLTISVRESDLDRAQKVAENTLREITAVGRSLGLDSADMQIGRLAISKGYESRDGNTTKKLSYYELSQPITFVERDLSRFDEFRIALASAENINIQQKFVTTYGDSVRTRLRIDALRQAKQKAEDLAEVVNMRVGKALSISEFRPDVRTSEVEGASYMVATATIGIAARPESETMEVRVYAVFELE